MNKAPKRARGVGGRRRAPAPNLVGRAGACRILGVDKRKLRRLEDRGIVEPALIEPDGVRWFDIEALHKLAVVRQSAMPRRSSRPPPPSRPKSQEPVTLAEAEQIFAWFAAGHSRGEVAMLSGKSRAIVRYLYARYLARNITFRPSTADALGDVATPKPQGSPTSPPPTVSPAEPGDAGFAPRQVVLIAAPRTPRLSPMSDSCLEHDLSAEDEPPSSQSG